MNTLDEYRRYARECQQMAESTQNSADRALWQRLATSWCAKLDMLLGSSESAAAQDRSSDPSNDNDAAEADQDSKASG